MGLNIGRALCALALLGASAGAAAQTIYRCGNTYTNHVGTVKEQGCMPVEGGPLTIIHSTAGSSNATAPQPVPRSSPRATPRADEESQRARDNDAKSILQAELSKAHAHLSSLKAEYNDGSPQRSALELRNPQAYLQRVEMLQADIARQESDIASIQRELGRLP